MPYVRVELLAGRTAEQKSAIARDITDSLVSHAGAKPESIFVVFEDVARENWATAGCLVSEDKQPA